MKFVITMLFAVSLTCGTAQSGPLKHATAITAVVGNLSIISFYTKEPDGLHVISTVRIGDADYAPVFRVMSVLLPNQEVEISVPQSLGSKPLELRLLCEGETIRQGPP
jgi:hypothetical protein